MTDPITEAAASESSSNKADPTLQPQAPRVSEKAASFVAVPYAREAAQPSEPPILLLITQLGGGQLGWVDEQDIRDVAIGPPGSRGEKETVMTRQLLKILATAVEEGQLEVRTLGCFTRLYRLVRA